MTPDQIVLINEAPSELVAQIRSQPAYKDLNYVAAEIYDEKFENHLNLAHCDEIILTTEYEHELLATASSGQGFSNVIRAMMGGDSHAGVFIEPISYKYYGKTYKEYAEARNNQTDGKKSILIGLLLNTGNFQRRRRDAIREAHKNPNVAMVIENLMKVKTLKSNEPVLLPDDDFEIRAGMKAIVVKVKEAPKNEDSNS